MGRAGLVAADAGEVGPEESYSQAAGGACQRDFQVWDYRALQEGVELAAQGKIIAPLYRLGTRLSKQVEEVEEYQHEVVGQ